MVRTRTVPATTTRKHRAILKANHLLVTYGKSEFTLAYRTAEEEIIHPNSPTSKV